MSLFLFGRRYFSMNMGASEGIKLSLPRAEVARQGGTPLEFDDAFRAH